MSSNNDKFLCAYNRLDNYLQTIVHANKNANLISYLESVLPEKQRSECKTIRKFKNLSESHGVHPGEAKPTVPSEWIKWLEDMLDFCKKNSAQVAKKVQEVYNLANKTSSSPQQGASTVKPLVYPQKSSSNKRSGAKPSNVQPKNKSQQTDTDFQRAKKQLDAEMIKKLDDLVFSSDKKEAIKNAEKYFQDLKRAKSMIEVKAVEVDFNIFYAGVLKLQNKKLLELRKEEIIQKIVDRQNETKSILCGIRYAGKRRKVDKIAKQYIEKVNEIDRIEERAGMSHNMLTGYYQRRNFGIMSDDEPDVLRVLEQSALSALSQSNFPIKFH